jgi:type I restriction enzyme S subunit
VLKVKHGYAFAGPAFSSDLSGLPIVVSIGNFDYRGGFRFATTQNREYRGGYPKEFELSPGDLLVVMTCQTAGGEILGLPARVPDDGRTYLHNQRIGLITTDDGHLDPRYAYYLFLSPIVNRQLAMMATGTKILHTSPQRIGEVEVSLPPLTEQRAIASVLGTLDEKIEANQRTVELEEQLATRLLDQAPRRIPLHDLAVVRRTTLDPASSGMTMVDHFSLPAFDERRLPVRQAGAEIKSAKQRIDDASVLVSRLNPHIPRVWYAVPEPGVLGVASTEFVVMTPLATTTAEELWACCNSTSFSSALAESVTGTTGSHQRVQAADVLSTKVGDPMSTTPAQRLAVNTMVKSAFVLRNESDTLMTLRDTLLPKLLSGELRVRDVESLVEEAV